MKTMKPKVNADKDTLDVGILLFVAAAAIVFMVVFVLFFYIC